MKKLFLLTFCLCLLSGCADVQHVGGLTGEPAGFLKGIWHGLIITFALIGKIFSDDIAIYAVNNTGGWYDFGFWLGAVGFAKGACKS